MTTLECPHPTESAEPFPARRFFSKEKVEEVMGIVFLTASFLLTGWFYYSLYLALHGHEIF